ncbi:unnamed protein product [Acanthoscelides obtectus]|uniref:Uncharacterized protein n=1 Tax=Acanthoscelides obtectus TaxID=200917 RepID=A0A9P0NY67_ACAOB|nr:unnamed protein product [Acanthoscelides obtectus]CAK1648884.1 hypothetical protein AOBTE_LOCUS15945 [Acanthoscelides obtectus]
MEHLLRPCEYVVQIIPLALWIFASFDSSALPGTSAASSTVRRPVKEASLKNQKQKEKLPETNETRHLSTQELQRLVLLEQLQVFRLAKEILLQKKQDQDSRQDNCDSQEVSEAQRTTTCNLEIHNFFNLDEIKNY